MADTSIDERGVLVPTRLLNRRFYFRWTPPGFKLIEVTMIVTTHRRWARCQEARSRLWHVRTFGLLAVAVGLTIAE